MKPPQEPSPPLKDHLRAKFCPDPSSHLDFYREQTHTHTDRQTDIALYVLEDWTLKSTVDIAVIVFNHNSRQGKDGSNEKTFVMNQYLGL